MISTQLLINLSDPLIRASMTTDWGSMYSTAINTTELKPFTLVKNWLNADNIIFKFFFKLL